MIAEVAKKLLYKVPVPSTSFLKEAYWDGSRFPSAIRFIYEVDGSDRQVGIEFFRPMVVRKVAESFCTVEHIEGCYDTLVEVEPSSWKEEMFTPDAQSKSRLSELHHYMIYLDSVGCFEILAERFNVSEEALPAERRQETKG